MAPAAPHCVARPAGRRSTPLTPLQVHGCADCAELVLDDVADTDEYGGHCLACRARRGRQLSELYRAIQNGVN